MATRKQPNKVVKFFRSPQGIRLTHQAPALMVFGVAAWQSYWHTVEVATHYGEGASAPIMPLGVDGMMVVAMRYLTHSQTKTGKTAAALGFLLGVAATVFINLLAADPNPISRTLAVLPAAGMVVTSAMLHLGERKAKRATRRR